LSLATDFLFLMIKRFALFSSLSLLLSAEEIDFSRDIRPILNSNCTGCHGGVKKQGGVSFLYREQVIAKGESGKPTVVPGDPEASEMMYRITTDVEEDIMPQPDHGPRLKDDEIALIRQWIKEGAKWNNHWSFEKPIAHTPPPVKNASWPKSDIDRFLLARMEKEGMSPARPAKPARLLRRLHLDLTGYPPSLEELDAFDQAYAADPDTAIREATDRLLASEAYGEKWATQWLDLARYADSEGMGIDRRWNTWPYRDWVIQALNNDMPYDEFIQKQLAGDLLPEPSLDDLIATNYHRLTQQNQEGGTDNEEFRTMAVMDRATTTWEGLQGISFGCVQCHDHPYDPIKHDEYYKFLAFFNSTRDQDKENHHPVLYVPHSKKDHGKATELLNKFKKLRSSIFEQGWALTKTSPWHKVSKMEVKSHKVGSEGKMDEGYLEFRTTGTIPKNTSFDLTIPKPAELEQLTAIRVHTLPLDLEKARHSGTLGAVISQIELSAIFPGETEPKKVELQHVIGDDINPRYLENSSLKKTKNGYGWGARTHQYHPRSCVIVLKNALEMPEGTVLKLSIEHSDNAPTGPLAIKRGRLDLTDDPAYSEWLIRSKSERNALRSTWLEYRKIGKIALPIMEDLPPHLERETRLFKRGNWLEKGDTPFKANTPASLHALGAENANRLDLARWITSQENPFTARVLVARVWEQIFGIGLVETLEDFGSAGILPTHGELLDTLAVRFQTEMNYSIKTLIHEILQTAVYRQSSKRDSVTSQKDQQNIFLSHGPRNRLSAEHVRDHHLHVSGLLSKKLYGWPAYPPIPSGVWKPFSAADKWETPKVGHPNRYRRSLYTYRKRSIPHPSMDAFDSPSRENCSTRRLASNTPLAALVTLNDEGFAEMSAGLARRMKYKTEGDLRTKLATGYRLATSTKPTKEQLDTIEGLFKKTEKDYTGKKDALKGLAGTADGAAFVVVANTLLNLDAALTK